MTMRAPSGAPSGFHGAEFPVRSVGGAAAVRVVHPGEQRIEAHRHDWPVLSLYRLGAYREEGEGGERLLEGPSVILHPAGAAHADVISDRGLETLVIGFDPSWLKAAPRLDRGRSYYWTGGMPSLLSARLARLWLDPRAAPDRLRQATADFLTAAVAAEAPVAPPWLSRADALVAGGEADAQTISRRLDLHPAWLARTYRAFHGEGVREAVRRRRIEKVLSAVRQGGATLAQAAVDAGFCDQSHMNRAFRAVLGRTPLEAIRDRAGAGAPL